jgi:hypothetical protein
MRKDAVKDGRLFRWHRSLRAALLLAAIAATALWAGAGMALGDGGPRTLWFVSNTLDTLRYACWFAFLASLLTGSVGHDPAGWRGAGTRWAAVGDSLALHISNVVVVGRGGHARPRYEGALLEFGLRLASRWSD